jgi:8-oxo-dGTP pyrophosphatase MutT (NUDIX family)
MKNEYMINCRNSKVKFPPRPYLSDEEYIKSCLAFIRVCVDVFFYNRKKKAIFLAKRIIPVKGWMGFGGAVNPGEDFEQAARRIIKQDTGLIIDPKKLQYTGFPARCIYEANGNPRDSIALQFSYEIDPEDILNLVLDPKEYEGVRAFDKDRLMRATPSLHPGVIEVFNIIFKD